MELRQHAAKQGKGILIRTIKKNKKGQFFSQWGAIASFVGISPYKVVK